MPQNELMKLYKYLTITSQDQSITCLYLDHMDILSSCKVQIPISINKPTTNHLQTQIKMRLAYKTNHFPALNRYILER